MNTDRRFLVKAQNKIPKTIISSNCGPLRRALCTLLLSIAAFWAMPRSACAQIYVSQGNFKVGAYDATTGVAINASFITGLSEAGGLVLSGNNLFVTNNVDNTVGEYNATTGAAINASFITGLHGPGALALQKPAEVAARRSGSRPPRCRMHKTANILDKMPKSVQGKAKQLIHEMYLAPTRKAALAAYDQFISSYQIKFPKACECVEKDKEVLFSFYDFPAQHWPHLRTTNPIESTFATVRLRTYRTKGCGSRIATLTMVFKLGLEAQKHWRRLQGFELIPKVVTGVRFVDGEEQTQQAA
jgi:hypothetical protein